MSERPKFHLTNFGGSFNLSMNPAMVLSLYHCVARMRQLMVDNNENEKVELVGLLNKIESNFKFMGETDDYIFTPSYYYSCDVINESPVIDQDQDELARHLIDNEPNVVKRVLELTGTL